MKGREKSMAWVERLKKIMPWGSSTCSKAVQFGPEEAGIIVRGDGCRVWDADGKEYIDFRNALGPITLGYRFPAVDQAIRAQLDNGIVFGHPHPLECEVAELLCEVIPCAEQARFLKTGGEANAACIRTARHFTGRNHIIQIGYNGWLNSLARGARALPRQTAKAVPPGVPEALSELYHIANWNDIEAVRALFKQYPGAVAALIISADYRYMAAGKEFYPALREITRKEGALLIFDEIVTGFRIATAGVQEYFNVTPDMAVFAKGMANGMPLAAYVGRKECMKAIEEVVVTSTYGGEALSLAAAKATIETYRTKHVTDHLWKMGELMWTGTNELAEKFGVPVRVEGFWPAPAFVFSGDQPNELKNRFFRAAYRNGLSLYDNSYVNFSHQKDDIEEALDRMERTLEEL